jgi:hypothetical protein
MFRIVSLSFAGFALLIGVSMSAGPANAVVYCKTVGVPKGCVVRPAVVAPVVAAPVAGITRFACLKPRKPIRPMVHYF